MRVLIVDEDIDTLGLLKRLLWSSGYEVTTAQTPIAAHDSWVAAPSEVIVVDVDVGGPAAGIRLAKGLRVLQPTLAVVFMTGGGLMEEPLDESVVIDKPFSRLSLLRAVGRALTR